MNISYSFNFENSFVVNFGTRTYPWCSLKLKISLIVLSPFLNC